MGRERIGGIGGGGDGGCGGTEYSILTFNPVELLEVKIMMEN